MDGARGREKSPRGRDEGAGAGGLIRRFVSTIMTADSGPRAGTSILAIPRWQTVFLTAWFTTLMALRCEAIRCKNRGKTVAENHPERIR
jgi:hypothetical protein